MSSSDCGGLFILLISGGKAADIISVSAGEQKAQRIPKPIRYRMNFRGQASSAPSGFLVISPFLAPLACWWTLIVALSSISVVSSTKSCSIRAVRVFSHTPAFIQARHRLYTLCHGPYRSGRSRHGIPVFSQYTIQDCVEHYPAAFSRPASLRLSFWRKLIPDPVPLLFAYLRTRIHNLKRRLVLFPSGLR